MFVFEKDTANNIIEILTGTRETELSELGKSVIEELGNIVPASYMNAIAKIYKFLTIIPSVPAVAYDMLGCNFVPQHL